MSRTHRRDDKPFSRKWKNKPGNGKRMKRRLHKAIRSGRERSIKYWRSEVNWRGW